jgi:hypothetical protein
MGSFWVRSGAARSVKEWRPIDLGAELRRVSASKEVE